MLRYNKRILLLMKETTHVDVEAVMQNEQSVPQNLIFPPKNTLHHLGNQGNTVMQTKKKKNKIQRKQSGNV